MNDMERQNNDTTWTDGARVRGAKRSRLNSRIVLHFGVMMTLTCERAAIDRKRNITFHVVHFFHRLFFFLHHSFPNRVSLESVACCKFHISEHKKYLFKIIIILWLWILFQSLANKILSWWFKLRIIYLLISVVFCPCLFNRNEAKKRHTKFKCDRTQKKMFNTKIAINGPRDIIRPDTNNFCIIA